MGNFKDCNQAAEYVINGKKDSSNFLNEFFTDWEIKGTTENASYLIDKSGLTILENYFNSTFANKKIFNKWVQEIEKLFELVP